jgi:hypothetical protein
VVIAYYIISGLSEKTEDSLKNLVMINKLQDQEESQPLELGSSIPYFKLSAVNVLIIPHSLTDVVTSVDEKI